jgi:hypothetical protein
MKKKEDYMNTDSSKNERIWRGTSRSCSRATRQCENLFFEMSRVVESPGMLMTWVEWFRRLHIPCAIAKADGGYSLWRKGTEVGRKRSKVPPVLIKENIVVSFGLAGRELNLLEEEREGAGDSCGGFEDVALPGWEESGENRFNTVSSVL